MPTSCPQCNHDLPPTSRFCPNCRAAVVTKTREDVTSIGDRQTADDESDEFLPVDLPFRPPSPRPDGDQKDTFAPLVFEEPAAASSTDRARGDETRVVPVDSASDSLIILSPDGDARDVRALTRPYYSIGRGQSKIRLDDPRVSRWHIALVKLGSRWVAVNRTDKRSMQVGGWNLRQKTLERGDVIRIGESWLVFVPAGTDPAVPPAPSNRAVSHAATLGSIQDDDDAAVLMLRAGNRDVAQSGGQPLLIGGHGSCDVTTAGASPFRAVISWLADGPTVISLGPPVLLGGRPVNRAALSHGDRIEIGGTMYSVDIYGDARLPFRQRVQRLRQIPRAMHVTAFYGPHCGKSLELNIGEWTRVGRAASCEFTVPKERRVADVQASLRVEWSGHDATRRPTVTIEDASNAGTTLINRSPISCPTGAAIGDVIQFGRPDNVAGTALILHHPLTSDAWPMEHDS